MWLLRSEMGSFKARLQTSLEVDGVIDVYEAYGVIKIILCFLSSSLCLITVNG